MKATTLITALTLTLLSTSAFALKGAAYAPKVKGDMHKAWNKVVRNLNKKKGYCDTLGKLSTSSASKLAKTGEFSQGKKIDKNCYGEIGKFQKKGIKYIAIKNTRCKYVLVGYSDKGSFVNAEETRMYELKQGKTLKVRLTNAALGSDGEVNVAVVAANGGSCSMATVNF